MPGPLIDATTPIMCPHMGKATTVAKNLRVRIGGQPVLLQTDVTTVAGCPFATGNVPSPCVIVKWVTASTRVRVMGQPVLLMDSQGVGQAATQAPQGPATVGPAQPRVKGI